MPDWLKAIIAGYGAKKLGGGCFSTILIFIVIYYALGTCNRPVRHAHLINDAHRQTASIRSPVARQAASQAASQVARQVVR
jgi:hypothetical protein